MQAMKHSGLQPLRPASRAFTMSASTDLVSTGENPTAQYLLSAFASVRLGEEPGERRGGGGGGGGRETERENERDGVRGKWRSGSGCGR